MTETVILYKCIGNGAGSGTVTMWTGVGTGTKVDPVQLSSLDVIQDARQEVIALCDDNATLMLCYSGD